MPLETIAGSNLGELIDMVDGPMTNGGTASSSTGLKLSGFNFERGTLDCFDWDETSSGTIVGFPSVASTGKMVGLVVCEMTKELGFVGEGGDFESECGVALVCSFEEETTDSKNWSICAFDKVKPGGCGVNSTASFFFASLSFVASGFELLSAIIGLTAV
jgi:hypothetical protein